MIHAMPVACGLSRRQIFILVIGLEGERVVRNPQARFTTRQEGCAHRIE
jgi:hypothetical protein